MTTDYHYHVQRHREDDDVYAALSMGAAMDYAAQELQRSAEHEHEGIRISGEAGEFEDAYNAWDRSETYSGLQANAANIAHQYSAEADDRAPLYRGDGWRERLAVAAAHIVETINADGPDGFVITTCPLTDCPDLPDDDEDDA